MRAKLIIFPYEDGFNVAVWGTWTEGSMRVRSFDNRTTMIALLEDLQFIGPGEAQSWRSSVSSVPARSIPPRSMKRHWKRTDSGERRCTIPATFRSVPETIESQRSELVHPSSPGHDRPSLETTSIPGVWQAPQSGHAMLRGLCRAFAQPQKSLILQPKQPPKAVVQLV